MLEILAPAGNAECAKAAIDNGADALYLGYSAFSARQSAENFSLEALKTTVVYAHYCGVKVYVAMNTVVKDEETEEFVRTLLAVWNVGVDAVILQDALLGKYIKALYPNVVLHLSTQAGVCNENGARFAKECGFSRVILARETPLLEIEKITKIIETEAFVQGALCTCFSGQCYFSSFAGGNSGNRGRCKQPCRKKYSYNRKGFEEPSYALSLADLSVGEEIGKYIQAGVTSFKIEGRMRRAEYVASAVRYYKAVLENSAEKPQALSDLKRTYNRGNYTKGLAFGQDKKFVSAAVQGHIGEKVGVVKVINGGYFVESVFTPRVGDAFKILREGKEVGGAVMQKRQGRGFTVSSKNRLKNGDGVFITTDQAVNERVLNAKRHGRVSLRLTFHENEKARIDGGGVTVLSQEPLQTANSSPLKAEELRVCFMKTDGLPLQVHFEEIDLQGNIFIPKSVLNALRRSFYERLTEYTAKKGRISCEYTAASISFPAGKNEKIAVIADEFEEGAADIAVYKPKDFFAPLPEAFKEGDFEKYLYYPPFCSAQDEQALDGLLRTDAFDGVYAENYAGIAFAEQHGLRVFAGTGLNLFNRISVSELLQRSSVSYYAISKETNEEEQAALVGDKAFVLSSGDIKLMDLCYCPFGKSCAACDKKEVYFLTDEAGREFPVRRYVDGGKNCRFEVYNCARLVGNGAKNTGKLLDLSVTKERTQAVDRANDVQKQKELYKNYTSGHFKRGVL